MPFTRASLVGVRRQMLRALCLAVGEAWWVLRVLCLVVGEAW